MKGEVSKNTKSRFYPAAAEKAASGKATMEVKEDEGETKHKGETNEEASQEALKNKKGFD